jgi:hypothetical protein
MCIRTRIIFFCSLTFNRQSRSLWITLQEYPQLEARRLLQLGYRGLHLLFLALAVGVKYTNAYSDI